MARRAQAVALYHRKDPFGRELKSRLCPKPISGFLVRPPTLCFDHGLTTHSRCGDGLAIMVIGAIAGDLPAGFFRLHLAVGGRNKIDLVAGNDHVLERRGVWLVVDGDKHAFHPAYGFGARFDILDFQAAHGACCYAFDSVSRGDAPVATITIFVLISRSASLRGYGHCAVSRPWTAPLSLRVPNFAACFQQFCIRS